MSIQYESSEELNQLRASADLSDRELILIDKLLMAYDEIDALTTQLKEVRAQQATTRHAAKEPA